MSNPNTLFNELTLRKTIYDRKFNVEDRKISRRKVFSKVN
jgi:hypothetical protein